MNLVVLVLQQEAEGKASAFLIPGFKEYLSVKLRYNYLADVEAEANALGVHLLRTFQAAEHFEEVLLLFFLYPNSVVQDLDHNFVAALVRGIDRPPLSFLNTLLLFIMLFFCFYRAIRNLVPKEAI